MHRRTPMATSKDDLILVSVDDHICEPADMFDAHVPDAVPRAGAARRRRARRRAAVVLRRASGAGTSGSNAVAGKPPEMFNVDPMRYEDMRPGCYDVRRAGARHVGRRAARGAELPELDRLLRPGAEPGSRPRREPRDDQGVQRLARRRVVRRVPRPLHPVRHPAAVRRATKRRRRCAGSPTRAATRSRSRRTPPGSACRASTPASGIRCSPRAATPAPCCAATSARRRSRRRHVARRAAAGADEPVVGDGDLHARRPAVGRLLAPLPDAAVRAHRGRHRVDPVLPAAGRAHARPAQRMDAARRAAGSARRPSCSTSGSCAASSTTASA